MTTYICTVEEDDEEDDYIVIRFRPVLYRRMNNPEYLVVSRLIDQDDKICFRWRLTPNEKDFAFENRSGTPVLPLYKTSPFAQWFLSRGIPATYHAEVYTTGLLKLWKKSEQD